MYAELFNDELIYFVYVAYAHTCRMFYAYTNSVKYHTWKYSKFLRTEVFSDRDLSNLCCCECFPIDDRFKFDHS